MLIDSEAVIKAVDRHTRDDGTLDEDISIILEELPSAESEAYNRGWKDGQEALRKEIWEDGRDRLD